MEYSEVENKLALIKIIIDNALIEFYKNMTKSIIEKKYEDLDYYRTDLIFHSNFNSNSSLYQEMKNNHEEKLKTVTNIDLYLHDILYKDIRFKKATKGDTFRILFWRKDTKTHYPECYLDIFPDCINNFLDNWEKNIEPLLNLLSLKSPSSFPYFSCK